MSASELATRFAALHHGDTPLLIPNPWDAGSALMLEHLGFQALATTSTGFAASIGSHDGAVARDRVLAGASAVVAATSLPVSADLENGFGATLDDVADTYRQAVATGLVGASIEDAVSGGGDDGDDESLFGIAEASDRVRAAVEAAHAALPGFVVTARAENYFHGLHDIADVIARLQAYQEAGADVLYAPGLRRADDIRAVTTSVDRPVNVLFGPTGLSVAQLGELGVARISVGGSFAFTAYGAAATAARELLEHGTTSASALSLSALSSAGHEATKDF